MAWSSGVEGQTLLPVIIGTVGLLLAVILLAPIAVCCVWGSQREENESQHLLEEGTAVRQQPLSSRTTTRSYDGASRTTTTHYSATRKSSTMPENAIAGKMDRNTQALDERKKKLTQTEQKVTQLKSNATGFASGADLLVKKYEDKAQKKKEKKKKKKKRDEDDEEPDYDEPKKHKRKLKLETEDESNELEHLDQRPRFPTPTSGPNYGASDSTTETSPAPERGTKPPLLPPRLPTRRYKLKKDGKFARTASSGGGAGRFDRNFQALQDRQDNLAGVEEATSDMESEAGIYSSLTAQLKEKYERKVSPASIDKEQSDLSKKKKKRKFKGMRKWWRKHVH